jgi:hypothetical protein
VIESFHFDAMSQRCSIRSAVFVIVLVAAGILASRAAFDVSGIFRRLGFGEPVGTSVEPLPVEPLHAALPAAEPGTTTAKPKRIDDVLTNPGMGFASFHFGWWCNLPPITFSPEECAKRVVEHWPQNYPKSGTAYFRWYWRDIEPKRGEIDFAMIDTAIRSANKLGMTLGFRVMTVAEVKSGLPDWLLAAPYEVAGQWRDGEGGKTFWPDYRDPTLQREHARLISALGKRYDGHPAVDHIDIGTVGCWGEWNTACLAGVDSIIDVYEPSGRDERRAIETAFTQLIDHHLSAFSKTPKVMLGLDPDGASILAHATRGGAGWRVDCWGDWGMWGGSWSHQGKLYPSTIAAAVDADPGFLSAWKRAPVQLEICGTLERWNELGWTAAKPDGEVYKTFQWALRQHASVLNAKSKPVPAGYVAAIDELLQRVGYRFVVDELNHQQTVKAGASTTITTGWSNLGVAPAYLPRTLAYRLRGNSRSVVFPSTGDTRGWLPGTWITRDTVEIPADLPAGTYEIDLALLDRQGTSPDTEALPPLFLGIAGRRPDGWYTVSRLTVE